MENPAEINQCDGCRRGLPIRRDNNHYDGDMPYMGCTRDRYQRPAFSENPVKGLRLTLFPIKRSS
jgi:hypothetical protein